jgi:hypothetical protein
LQSRTTLLIEAKEESMSEWDRFLRRCATAHRVVIETCGPVRLTRKALSSVDMEANPNDTELMKGGDRRPRGVKQEVG